MKAGRPRAKILFFVTEDWYFFSHRLPLARAAVEAGFEVVLITRIGSHRREIESAGIRVIPIPLQRRSINPLRELKTLWRLISVFRCERPDLVHLVALKPMVQGGLAALLTGVGGVVNAVAGLGYIFTSSQMRALLLRPVLTLLIRFLLNRPRTRVICQNPDDRELLTQAMGVERNRTVLIRGAGVDPEAFTPSHEQSAAPPMVLLASRMLWAKGVGEFVAAAEILRKRGTRARLVLVGAPDPENPDSVPESRLRAWREAGPVEWWGPRSDMAEVFRQAHIVCLPTSYGEGVPKVLLEAAASCRALIASDAPGCREVVRHGVNGLLVPVKDCAALAAAMEQLIGDADLRRRMGVAGREIVLREFSLDRVVSETMAIYDELLLP